MTKFTHEWVKKGGKRRLRIGIDRATLSTTTSKSSANAKATVALKKLKQLDRDMERKYYDAQSQGSVFSNTPVLFSLSAPVQGSADNQRTGDSIKLTSIDLKIDLLSSASASFRIIIFYWNVDDTGPTLPTIANILSVLISVSLYPITPYVVDARKQFTIVKDKSFTLDAGQALGRIIKVRKGLKRKVQFTAGGTTGTGKLYMFIMSDLSNGGACNVYSRIRFIDN